MHVLGNPLKSRLQWLALKSASTLLQIMAGRGYEGVPKISHKQPGNRECKVNIICTLWSRFLYPESKGNLETFLPACIVCGVKNG